MRLCDKKDFFSACAIGNVQGITRFFDAHVDDPQYIVETINSYDSEAENYPLVAAVQHSFLYIAEKLLDFGADIEIGSNSGITPLVMACIWGLYHMVELLITRGANIETKQEDGKTPLIVAIERSDSRVVQLLLEKGADVNVMVVSDRSELAKNSIDIITVTSPLHLAISNKFNAGVALLVKYGAMYEHKDTLRDENHFITSVWQLCERDKHTEKLYKSLLGGQWTTKNHYRHPQCIKDAVFTVLLINKRLNGKFDKLFLYNLFSLIAYSWKK